MRQDAKITSKGQVTIPSAVRRLLGVKTGDRLIFEGDEEGVRVRASKEGNSFAKYRGIGNPGVPSGRASVVRLVRQLRGR